MNWNWDGFEPEMRGSISVDPDEPDWFGSRYFNSLEQPIPGYTLPSASTCTSKCTCTVHESRVQLGVARCLLICQAPNLLCTPRLAFAPLNLIDCVVARPAPVLGLALSSAALPSIHPPRCRTFRWFPGHTNHLATVCAVDLRISPRTSPDSSLVLTRIQGLPPSTTWHDGCLLFGHQG